MTSIAVPVHKFVCGLVQCWRPQHSRKLPTRQADHWSQQIFPLKLIRAQAKCAYSSGISPRNCTVASCFRPIAILNSRGKWQCSR